MEQLSPLIVQSWKKGMRIWRVLLVSTLLLLAHVASEACDLCGCYTPQLNTMAAMQPAPPFGWLAGWYAAIGEQFTHFGTVQIDGHEAANPSGQYENSFITQLVAGYTFRTRFALQVSLPLIYREFKRPEGFRIDRGSESGVGDASLLLKTDAFHFTSGARRTFDVSGKNPVAIEHEPDFTVSSVFLTGIKFPTGATSRLKEEFHEVVIPGAPPSGIHGHDLTLGTGSYDGIFGEQNSVRYKNFFAETSVQFTLRGDGAHQYHFANDLIWDGGPGYYFIRRRDAILGLQFVVSGEHKDKDRFRGKLAEDTGVTSVFVGPRAVASLGRWSAELEIDVPALIDNTALQVVPDYRIRGGVSVHF
jgi:hypothetical protein